MTVETLKKASALEQQIRMVTKHLESLRESDVLINATDYRCVNIDLSSVPGLKDTAINLLELHLKNLEAEFAAL